MSLVTLDYPVVFSPQTFEAKLLHVESRPARKGKNSPGPGDLEFFIRCEVHGADLDVFINSLRKVADDIRTFPEEKGRLRGLHKVFSCGRPVRGMRLTVFFFIMLHCCMCLIINSLPPLRHSSLVPSED